MDILDLRGKPCPIPVIEAKKALRAAAPGGIVRILVDNDAARRNLAKMAEGLGHGFRHEPGPEGGILATLTAGAAAGPGGAGGPGLVVAIGGEAMGAGNDDLGRVLMKSFIYSLTELEPPPERLLFFNGGVKLTTEGSNALADLETLANKGAAIDSCGACLDFHGLTGKLKVGGVTNMFAIAGAMAKAGRLINL